MDTRGTGSALRWRGVLEPGAMGSRALAAVTLAMLCAALAFGELSLVSVPSPGGTVTYIALLLAPVAVCSLSLGTAAGTVLGLFAGAMLYVHSILIPTSYQELVLVTPLSSIALFGACGLLAGILFAVALRNCPAGGRRAARLAVACLAIVVFFGAGLLGGAVAMRSGGAVPGLTDRGLASFYDTMGVASARSSWQAGVARQLLANALVLALLCLLADAAARWTVGRLDDVRIRDAFRIWILFAALLAFVVATSVSFVAITVGGHDRAEASMRTEVNYLCLQLEKLGRRVEAFDGIARANGIDEEGVAPEDLDGYRMLMDPVGGIIEGYTMGETGTVALIHGGRIIATDDPRLPVGADVGGLLGDDILAAMGESARTGTLQRILYDGVLASADEANGKDYQVQIGYLLAATQGDYGVMIIEPSELFYKNRPSFMAALTGLFLVLLGMVSLIVTILLNNMVARRIDETNETLRRVAEGDLDARAETTGTWEFKSLASGVNHTVEALRGWIVEAETRMDAELAAAREIQESALPSTFPPFPDILKFDVYATMDPAREVGGDFYDFFLLGDSGPDGGRLAFMVADVSGKGVPAALFMMKAKTQIRDYLHSGAEVGEALSEVNRQLLDGNDAGMFVTAWVGVLDYATGRLDYVNAGHNPPLLWRRDGGWRWMRERSGPVLGLFEDIPYATRSTACSPEETLLLYTDGVTEAFDVSGEAFGEGRLLGVAEECFRLHPRELVEAVRGSVAGFAGDAEQSDDITVLALEMGVPPEVTATLEVPARIEELDRLNEFIRSELDRRLCPQRVQRQLEVAVEELFVNVCKYAYRDAPDGEAGTVRVQRTYGASPASITIDIMDAGVPFNPLAKPDVALPTDIDDVPIGGLGILMAKRCVDELRYEHADGRNVTTIVKRW